MAKIFEKEKWVFKLNSEIIVKVLEEAWLKPAALRKRLNACSWLIDFDRVLGINGETRLELWRDPRDRRLLKMMPIK